MKKTSILKVFCGTLLLAGIIVSFSGCTNSQLSQTAKDTISENADKLARLVDETTHYKADCSLSIQAKNEQGEFMKNSITLSVKAGEKHQVIAERIEST